MAQVRGFNWFNLLGLGVSLAAGVGLTAFFFTGVVSTSLLSIPIALGAAALVFTLGFGVVNLFSVFFGAVSRTTQPGGVMLHMTPNQEKYRAELSKNLGEGWRVNGPHQIYEKNIPTEAIQHVLVVLTLGYLNSLSPADSPYINGFTGRTISDCAKQGIKPIVILDMSPLPDSPPSEFVMDWFIEGFESHGQHIKPEVYLLGGNPTLKKLLGWGANLLKGDRSANEGLFSGWKVLAEHHPEVEAKPAASSPSARSAEFPAVPPTSSASQAGSAPPSANKPK